MPAGETGFDDVVFDLISVQYHSLKAGHDYGQYVRDAKNAGLDEIASFFEQVMAQDAERAKRCHEYISQLISKDRGGPASSGGVAYSSLDAAAE
jgi:rubrerythrin